MSARKLSAVAIVAGLCAATVFASTASAGAGSAQRTATKVSINSWPHGLFGTAESSQKSCAKNRGIKVFKQLGSARDPGTDKLVGTASARKRTRAFTDGRTSAFQWALVKPLKKGSFYAKARKAEGCRSGVSGSYEVRPRARIPSCPSHQQVCHFDELHLNSGSCHSFTFSSGNCGGNSLTGDYPWNASGESFQWVEGAYPSGPPNRYVHYTSYSQGRLVGEIVGTMPGPGDAAYNVTYACTQGTERLVYYYTPKLPTDEPGEEGGPLHVDFQANGVNIYIRGYLYYGGSISGCA